MNELQIFNNPEIGFIRTTSINDEPWFCLTDVCKILDLEQVTRVKARLKEDGVTTSKVIDNLGRKQEATFINESNLYKTIFQSRKKEAEAFTDWVTSEVLPAIRKTGQYTKGLSTDDYMKAANILVKAKKFQLPFLINILNQAGFPVDNIPTVEVIEATDSVRDFFKENGTDIEGETTSFIYDCYKKYCELNNYKPLCHGEFSKQIKSYGYKIVDKKINGVKCRIFQTV